mgnify:FL=1
MIFKQFSFDIDLNYLKNSIEKLFFFIFLIIILNTTNAKLFIWIGGPNITNDAGVYGQKGVPDKNNIPRSRSGSITWIDSSNNLYLFGGATIASNSM